jgi:hypothetical protein
MEVFAFDAGTLVLKVEGNIAVDRLKEQIEAVADGTPIVHALNAAMVGDEHAFADLAVCRQAGLDLAAHPGPLRAPQQGSTSGELLALRGMGDGMRARWAQVSTSARSLEEAKAALLQANGGGKLKKKLKINVGGTVFKNVQRETLCRVPESHLAELFSGRWEEQLLRDRKGLIFLDVQPEAFGEILTFLNDLKLRPDDPIGVCRTVLVPVPVLPGLTKLFARSRPWRP